MMRSVCEDTARLVQSGSFENVSNTYLQFACTLSRGRTDFSVILVIDLYSDQKKTFLFLSYKDEIWKN